MLYKWRNIYGRKVHIAWAKGKDVLKNISKPGCMCQDTWKNNLVRLNEKNVCYSMHWLFIKSEIETGKHGLRRTDQSLIWLY